MPISLKSISYCCCLGAAVLALAACSPRRVQVLSVSDLMDDRVMLDGVLMKCNQNPSKARTDSDCMNARVAINRLAARPDPAEDSKRAEDFERSREQLRLSQEKQRQEQEAKSKVDAYHLPLVPVDPAPAPNNQASPPVARESNP
jgi:hypothetical protein